MSAPTLAGTTLPSPKVYKRRRTYRGGRTIKANGQMVTDMISTTAKHDFEMAWSALTANEFAAVRTAFDALKNSSGTFVDIYGTTYTVTLHPDQAELADESVPFRPNLPRINTGIKLREV